MNQKQKAFLAQVNNLEDLFVVLTLLYDLFSMRGRTRKSVSWHLNRKIFNSITWPNIFSAFMHSYCERLMRILQIIGNLISERSQLVKCLSEFKSSLTGGLISNYRTTQGKNTLIFLTLQLCLMNKKAGKSNYALIT